MSDKLRLLWAALLFCSSLRADFFGGDLPLLAKIVADTTAQLAKLNELVGTNSKTLEVLQQANRGIQDAVTVVNSANDTLAPGVLSDLHGVQALLSKIQDLYGKYPTAEKHETTALIDQMIAESLNLHNEAFRYAQKLDPQVDTFKQIAQSASPGSAQKLTAQSVGVLIHATNQVLRTNAALLKIQSQQLASKNRENKIKAANTRATYFEIPQALIKFKPGYDLVHLP